MYNREVFLKYLCVVTFFTATVCTGGNPLDMAAHFSRGGNIGIENGGILIDGEDFSNYSIISVGAWINFDKDCDAEDCLLHTIFSTISFNRGDTGGFCSVGSLKPIYSKRQLAFENYNGDWDEYPKNEAFNSSIHPQVPANEWIYVYYSRDISKNKISLKTISNNTVVKSVNASPTLSYSDNGYFVIGCLREGSAARLGFSGDIDNLSIWNKELSDDELLELAYSPNTTNPDLLYFFNFDNGHGPVISRNNVSVSFLGQEVEIRNSSLQIEAPTVPPTPPTGVSPTSVPTKAPTQAPTSGPTSFELPLTIDIIGMIVFNGNYILTPNHKVTFREGGHVNITGCFTPSGTLVVHTDEEQDTERTLFEYSCINSTDGFSDILFVHSDSCKKVESSIKQTSSKFSVAMNINNTCSDWWKYLVISIAILLVLLIVVAMIVAYYVPSLRARIFPFEKRPMNTATRIQVEMETR